jgi:methylenetetrahydrofolate--tRNA-(uracil-5-)-methyltransferase
VACAEAHAVPAGGALAVDREGFARAVTERLNAHPLITLHRKKVQDLEVIAPPSWPRPADLGRPVGPRCSGLLARTTCSFHDAAAPIVTRGPPQFDIIFRAGREGLARKGQPRPEPGETGGGDDLNCPFYRPGYEAFVEALATAENATLHHPETTSSSRAACLSRCWPEGGGTGARLAHLALSA